MTRTKNKILILVPANTARGGITNYYQVLINEFPPEIEYFERGARTWPIRKGRIPELVRAFQDYQSFKKRIRSENIKLVQSTTSLSINTTIRDGLFLRHAHRKGIKTIVFFRGWDDKAEIKLKKIYLTVFKYFFFFADAFITLSERTKLTLENFGYKKKIYLETTLVDKKLIDTCTKDLIIQKFAKQRQDETLNLLFLSRLEKRKGIYELYNAYKKLKSNSMHRFHLTICGDGFELEILQKKILDEGVEDIKIMGFVSGDQKKRAFQAAHIFVFPSHGEGMPNAVLEAMGFGLPVITTPVGGLIDFFEDGKNGYFIKKNNPDDIEEKIKILMSNEKIVVDIALTNFRMAKERFCSDKVARRVQTIFDEVASN